ncbi:MAG: hypothetical protein STSR0009_06560 [Methanoregula sp.]
MIAADVPALPEARRVDGADVSRTFRVFAQQRAGTRYLVGGKGVRERIRIFCGDMDREELVCEMVPYVKIPV